MLKGPFFEVEGFVVRAALGDFEDVSFEVGDAFLDAFGVVECDEGDTHVVFEGVEFESVDAFACALDFFFVVLDCVYSCRSEYSECDELILSFIKSFLEVVFVFSFSEFELFDFSL